jgi:Tol biopolymer transport system component
VAIERVSVASDGSQALVFHSNNPALSADGRYVAFTNSSAVYVRDRQTRTMELVASVSGYAPVISADGRYVVFHSEAANLVPNDTNGVGDIFVRDRQTGTTTRVSVDSSGAQANGVSNFQRPAISADGRYVAFHPFNALVPGDTNNAEDVFVVTMY